MSELRFEMIRRDLKRFPIQSSLFDLPNHQVRKTAEELQRAKRFRCSESAVGRTPNTPAQD